MTTALRALDALHAAVGAARVLGLDVVRAESVRAEASARLRIAPDAYVAALVGGTGVGKSSLLNALAGQPVSTAGPRRPTTGRTVAWVPAGDEVTSRELRPLLEHLDVGTVVEHGGDLANVVILDLPDIDSLEPSHRAAVEAVLPKVDVVVWVTDPEKYADAVFHDTFLRDWMSRLDRQIVILNKADRLPPDAARSVVADLGSVLRRELPALQRHAPEIILTRAVAGAEEVGELRRWFGEAVDAKAVIVDRLVAGARTAIADLAGLAGVTATESRTGDERELPRPIIAPRQRERAIDAASNEVLRVVDLRGVERQAVASTRAQARRRGTGPIGLVTTAIYRATGRNRAAADPAGYLRAWRRRGGFAKAAEMVRSVITAALPAVPVALRSQYAATGRAGELEDRIGTSVDAVISRQRELEPPSSRFWPVFGLLQSANTLLLVAAAVWIVVWILARPEVASYDVPIPGPVPAPLALLTLGLVLGFVLARALSLHAGWLGRRWARRTTGAIRSAVHETVAIEAFASIDRLETARADLAKAWHEGGSMPPTAPEPTPRART